LGSGEESVAVGDHLTIVIIEDDAPSSDVPAAGHASDSVHPDDPVEEVVSKWGGGLNTEYHKDDTESNKAQVLSSVFHFRFLF